jgi:hypothetical protein
LSTTSAMPPRSRRAPRRMSRQSRCGDRQARCRDRSRRTTSPTAAPSWARQHAGLSTRHGHRQRRSTTFRGRHHFDCGGG